MPEYAEMCVNVPKSGWMAFVLLPRGYFNVYTKRSYILKGYETVFTKRQNLIFPIVG